MRNTEIAMQGKSHRTFMETALGNLILKGSGAGALNISAGANAASAAMRASLGDIDGSSSGTVYGPAVPYGTPVFLGIKIDNVAGGTETLLKFKCFRPK